MTTFNRIPDDSAWYGYESDLDVDYMHDLFFGKSIEEVQEYFGGGRSIERMDELLYSPRPVFQYYVQAFALFVTSEKAIGDPDSASPFLSLLAAREEKDPGSVKEVFPLLRKSVEFVAQNQKRFNADEDIYGDFQDRAQHILELCDA